MHPEVYEAAKSGNFDDLMTIILRHGEDSFYQTTPKQNNILHVAAQYKQLKLIGDLLQCPSGPFLLWEFNKKGDTPLHLAAKLGSYEAVRVFTDLVKSLLWVLQNGQNDLVKELLRKPNLHKDTALHYAARGGYDGVVKLLIEEDPQLCDITNAANESPLYIAVHQGFPRTIEQILSAFSLSSSYKGPKGLTALHAAVCSPETWTLHQGFPHTMEHILRRHPGIPPTMKQIIRSFSLHAAVRSPQTWTWWLKLLEKRQEVIREQDDLGWTPLHYFACWGKVEAVRLLLQHDTSVAHIGDKEGQSALHIAAFEGHVHVIKELVRLCPDAWDIINNKEQTALHAAVIGGRVNVATYILAMPNPENLINEQDADGNTALHLAAVHKKYDIICILARDSRVNGLATNKDHLTAAEIFSAHEEIGLRAEKAKYVLKNYCYGAPGYQGWVIKYVKKRLDKQPVEDLPAVSTTAGSNPVNQGNLRSSKKDFIDLQVLVATLIATVTFAASFTVPGGYNSDGPEKGMATFAGKAAFHAFLISNVTAFSFSILALYILLVLSVGANRYQERYAHPAGYCIGVAMVGMMIAFGTGTHVVLTRTMGLRIFPYVLYGCLLMILFIGVYLDPEYVPPWETSFLKNYIRNLLFDYGDPEV